MTTLANILSCLLVLSFAMPSWAKPSYQEGKVRLCLISCDHGTTEWRWEDTDHDIPIAPTTASAAMEIGKLDGSWYPYHCDFAYYETSSELLVYDVKNCVLQENGNGMCPGNPQSTPSCQIRSGDGGPDWRNK